MVAERVSWSVKGIRVSVAIKDSSKSAVKCKKPGRELLRRIAAMITARSKVAGNG